jgi:hypothetical protein
MVFAVPEQMKEIGGYFGLEEYAGCEYHNNALALNTGRNCLRYLIRARQIHKLALPIYNCNVVEETAQEEGLQIIHYEVGLDLKPLVSNIDSDTWLYVINYFGQNTEYIKEIIEHRDRVIVDNAQAFFTDPIEGTDTLYTCRKYFGVPDGAYLYTDAPSLTLKEDHSCDRMKWINGRYEFSAADFFDDYRWGEDRLQSFPIRRMSKLTHNLLRPIDYEAVQRIREENFNQLDAALNSGNNLKLITPQGPYMYPLLLPPEKAEVLRHYLVKRRIYSATLWPDLLKLDYKENAYKLAQGIITLPCDQRYTKTDMDNVIKIVLEGLEA